MSIEKLVKVFKKSLLLLVCATLFSACSKKSPEPSKVAEAKPAATAASPAQASPQPTGLIGALDWSSVPEAKAEIGSYPFFAAPEGMRIGTGAVSGVSKTGVTTEKLTSKNMFYDGTQFFVVEGKLAKMSFDMASGSQSFENVAFDNHFDQKMESLGAKLVFKGRTPSEKTNALEALDAQAKDQFLRGGWRGDAPIRVYAIKSKDTRLIVQLYSNTAEGALEFVQLKPA
jgi:OmpA-OmpF porin, OOP family